MGRKGWAFVIGLWSVAWATAAPAAAYVDFRSVTTETFPYTGGKATLRFSYWGDANQSAVVPVSVDADGGWLTVKVASVSLHTGSKGSAQGKVTYRVAKYAASAPSPRRGTIRVGEALFTVYQTGAPCQISVRSAGSTAGPAAGVGEVAVTAPLGCGWTVVSSPSAPWLAIEGSGSGDGVGTVFYRVEANATGKKRTGTLRIRTVAARPQRKRHRVSQTAMQGGNPPPVDTAPPAISSTSPAAGATAVGVGAGITATFSETLSPLTVNPSTLALRDPDGTAVSGRVTYSAGTATFTPSEPLAYDTTYTAAITTGVKDGAGNALPEAYTWSFTTGPVPRAIALVRRNAVTERPSKVTLLFQARDKASGRPVSDLLDADFTVTESGAPVTHSEHFREVLKRSSLPYTLHTVLLVDVSASISGTDLEQMKATVRRLVAAYDPDTGKIARDPVTGKVVSNLIAQQTMRIYVFDDGLREVTSGWTSDPEALLAAVDEMQRGGPSTDLYGAIIKGVELWSDDYSPNRISQGFLVAITDGRDTAAVNTLNEALAARGTKNVYAVGVGAEVEPDKLMQLASTGGYFPLTSYAEVQAALEDVQAQMERFANSFYYLYYASPKRSGSQVVTLSVAGNTNVGPDASISYKFDADGFSSVLPEITVTGPTALTTGESAEWVAKTWWAYDAENFSWTSSNPEVLTVVVNPLTTTRATVKAVGPGQADITVTDNANTHYSSTDPKYGQNVSEAVTATSAPSVAGATTGQAR